MIVKDLEQKIEALNNQVQELAGSVKTLESQYSKSVEKLNQLKANRMINLKAIELLTLVQRCTKELICEIFTNIVSKALVFIYQDDRYKFELEFGKRGNLSELSLQLKTPDMQKSHSILNCRAGGHKDVISLALRLVLLEISHNKGFLFFDEPYKRLDNEETIQKAIEFVQETQRDTNRQIFIITHKEEVVNSVTNPIVIKNDNVKINESKPIQKKRGRPKKND